MKRWLILAVAIHAFVWIPLTAAPYPCQEPVGDFHHNGPAFVASGEMRIEGRASGAGDYTGDGGLVFEHAFSPGNSPAIVNIAPQVVFTPTNTLTMEIGGATPGPGSPIDNGYDKLIFTSAATPQITWGGSLVIQLFNGYSPAVGSEFDLFDFDPARDAGAFSSIIIQDNGLLPPHSILDTTNLYLTGVVRVVSTLTPIEQWRQLHFGITTDTGDAANLFDFDADGAVNLIEYALGMDPKLPGTAGLPVVGKVNIGGNDYLALTITRPLTATDITYRFQIGATPATLLSGSLYSSGGDVPNNAFTSEHSRIPVSQGETITIRDNTPISSGNPPRFMRLGISIP
jgi:hypothetical protein